MTLIRIEIEPFEHQILPPLMKRESEEARRIEARLIRPMTNFTLFEDDTLVPEYYGVAEHFWFIPFGMDVKRQETGSLGHHFIPYLHELEEDDHLLGPSVFGVDAEGTRKAME